MLALPQTHTTTTQDNLKDINEEAASSSLTKRPANAAPPKIRTLREVKLDTPIRYGIERWLHTLLFLDATISLASALHDTPHPSQCELFCVSRDTLLSYYPTSEAFLQRMVALYVASH